MDNMKPLIDAVSEDTAEEATPNDEAGRPDSQGAGQGGQRGSSCGHHGRRGPPHWAGMMSFMGPPGGRSWGPPYGPSCGPPCGPSCGPSCGPQCGPPCGASMRPPCGPPCGPSCGASRGPPCGPPCGPSCGASRGPPCGPPCGPSCGASRGPPCGPPCGQSWGPSCGPYGMSPCGPPCRSSCGPPCGHPGGPRFMNGPPQWACPWDRGMAPMTDSGPMTCPWGGRPPWADETVGDENDEKHDGKENAKDAGNETQQDGAEGEKSGQQRPRCPWVDRMRRHRMRHATADCRRRDQCPMYGRCRRGFGARPHCAPWSTGPGDCCQPGARMGWGDGPHPPPFFCSFAGDSAGESNSDPENDNPRSGCHGNGRGWQCGPPRNELYQMLSWKRKVLKEKLQRIESHLERLRPSEDETNEATTGQEAGPEQASRMSSAPEAASPMDTHVGQNGERDWEVIADSE